MAKFALAMHRRAARNARVNPNPNADFFYAQASDNRICIQWAALFTYEYESKSMAKFARDASARRAQHQQFQQRRLFSFAGERD